MYLCTKTKITLKLRGNSYEAKEEWVLSTSGLNLLEIMNCPNEDYARTHSNDIYEMYEMLGIEAARSVLLNEIREVALQLCKLPTSCTSMRHND